MKQLYEPLVGFFGQIAAEIQEGGGSPEQKDDALSHVMRRIALTFGDMIAYQSAGELALEDFTRTVKEGFHQALEREQQ